MMQIIRGSMKLRVDKAASLFFNRCMIATQKKSIFTITPICFNKAAAVFATGFFFVVGSSSLHAQAQGGGGISKGGEGTAQGGGSISKGGQGTAQGGAGVTSKEGSAQGGGGFSGGAGGAAGQAKGGGGLGAPGSGGEGNASGGGLELGEPDPSSTETNATGGIDAKDGKASSGGGLGGVAGGDVVTEESNFMTYVYIGLGVLAVIFGLTVWAMSSKKE